MEVLENEVQYEITKKRLEFTEKTLNDFKANSNNLNEEDLELQLSILRSRIEEFKELIYLYENIKIASSNIFSLEDNQIFVFGSNLSGRHGLGAAKTAMKWGAKYGQAEGLQGQTYGIPTVNSLVTKKLSLHEIETYVNNFIELDRKSVV
jgi:lantibiotic modifying enzyme